jgi:hypothetical protein
MIKLIIGVIFMLFTSLSFATEVPKDAAKVEKKADTSKETDKKAPEKKAETPVAGGKRANDKKGNGKDKKET